MARKVFYSFYYREDSWRASQIRNIGIIEGNAPVSDNDWESIRSGGDSAIQNWIDKQLIGKSCTIVLIGSNTAGRKWIKYEIEKSWNDGKGVFGIYIHNLLDRSGRVTSKGINPFREFTMNRDNASLSSIVKAYDPVVTARKNAYNYISENLISWVEEAIYIRNKY